MAAATAQALSSRHQMTAVGLGIWRMEPQPSVASSISSSAPGTAISTAPEAERVAVVKLAEAHRALELALQAGPVRPHVGVCHGWERPEHGRVETARPSHLPLPAPMAKRLPAGPCRAAEVEGEEESEEEEGGHEHHDYDRHRWVEVLWVSSARGSASPAVRT
ncbi:hypothetical protein BRADI_3g11577v3 [Brachypodium distachyon]|uniref:Uncharacterized protein n=1 Tax=Brachypodium distachyon TaxID=15368 RepID=A0A0Q3LQ14_BRADI|nr:hypothetical protein BRADI_3g11577v3 [Brachypodium distachyon]